MTHSPATTGSGGARTMTIVGFVCAAVALLFAPIVFGPIAIVLGVLAYRRGDRLGVWAAVAGGITMIVGMALGAILFAANNGNGS